MLTDRIHELTITRETDKDNYKRYCISGHEVAGRIILEKYDEKWNLELMDILPTNCGIGTFFLHRVLELEKLNPENMTVCPISKGSRRFFQKNGFDLKE